MSFRFLMCLLFLTSMAQAGGLDRFVGTYSGQDEKQRPLVVRLKPSDDSTHFQIETWERTGRHSVETIFLDHPESFKVPHMWRSSLAISYQIRDEDDAAATVVEIEEFKRHFPFGLQLTKHSHEKHYAFKTNEEGKKVLEITNHERSFLNTLLKREARTLSTCQLVFEESRKDSQEDSPGM